MKKVLSTIFCCAFISTSVFAQKIKVKNENENLGGGSHPTFTVIVYETDEKTVEKEWKSLMKDYKAKVSSSGDGLLADNALIKDIGTNTLDIYSKTKKEENGTKLYVAIDMGGTFMSPSQHASASRTIEKIMENFARNLAKESVASQQKTAERDLDKLTKQNDRLIRDNESLHKDIENYKNKIQKAEDEITKNLKEQEVSKQNIEAQKKVVADVVEKAKKID